MLEASIEELKAYQCQVVMISFGERKGAELWIEETKCQFQMLLDPSRELYRLFGMKRSFAKVLERKTLIRYVGLLLKNVAVPRPFEGIEDDALQMGGDVIFNEKGGSVLTHLSKTPFDRPTFQSVLQLIKDHEKPHPEQELKN